MWTASNKQCCAMYACHKFRVTIQLSRFKWGLFLCVLSLIAFVINSPIIKLIYIVCTSSINTHTNIHTIEMLWYCAGYAVRVKWNNLFLNWFDCVYKNSLNEEKWHECKKGGIRIIEIYKRKHTQTSPSLSSAHDLLFLSRYRLLTNKWIYLWH